MKEKYAQGGVRKITKTTKARNGRTKTVTVGWRGYLRYQVDNPNYVEPPEQGEDTRTPAQRRRKAWREITQAFDQNSVKTKSDALDALAEWKSTLNDQAEKEQEKSGARKTVAQYVTTYIDTIEAAGTVRPSGISDYRTSAKRISEGIGDVVLADLTPEMIQEWETSLLKAGKGTNTVLKYHRLLNSVFRHAIETRDLDWNPCTAVKKPKRKPPTPNSLTANQHARLIATLAAMAPSQTVTAATIAVYTGMREGEICGLKWKYCDLDAGIIHIENAVARAGGKTYEDAPKTDAGRRDVPIHPNLATALKRRRAEMLSKIEETGETVTPEEFAEYYVIGYADGRYISPTIVSRNWKALSESFELTGTQGRAITFHDLRHTFATRAIAAGADVKAVAAVLGHSDAHVTLNVYADADKESKLRAVALVGQSIAEQGTVEPYAELAQPGK